MLGKKLENIFGKQKFCDKNFWEIYMYIFLSFLECNSCDICPCYFVLVTCWYMVTDELPLVAPDELHVLVGDDHLLDARRVRQLHVSL